MATWGGVIANILWHEIPNHSQNVELDAYVIMPNHFHAIIDIGENKYNTNRDLIDTNIPQGLNGQQGSPYVCIRLSI